MKFVKVVSIGISVALLIFGCATSSLKETLNGQLIQDKAPYRYVEVVNKKDHKRMVEKWAGEKGLSIAENSPFKNKILKLIEDHCGHKEFDLTETRIVSHKNPVWEEVWVFNDEKSKREDKTSGLTVLITYSPQTNLSNIDMLSNCHAKPEVSYESFY